MELRDFIANKRGACPFCEPKDRIIVELPSAFVTYNIAPYHKHHLMVVPKRHIVSVREFSPEESQDMDALIKHGIELLHKLGYQFVALLMRDGKHPGKSIEHLHYHLVPEMDFRPEPDSARAKREDKREILTPEQTAETLADFDHIKNS